MNQARNNENKRSHNPNAIKKHDGYEKSEYVQDRHKYNRKIHKSPNKNSNSSLSYALTPSQAISKNEELIFYRKSNSTTSPISCSDNNQTRHHDENKNKKTRKQLKNYTENHKRGYYPDVTWRAIPMKHLRMHPNFNALSNSFNKKLKTIQDVQYIPQDSWQWDALHKGRCTSSVLPSALGFLEPNASAFLKVPKGWTQRLHKEKKSGGIKAYSRLIHCHDALVDVETMNRVLFSEEVNRTTELQPSHTVPKRKNQIWSYSEDSKYVANYNVLISQLYKKNQAHKERYHKKSMSNVRLQWGSKQEATTILTALNYFNSKTSDSSNIMIQEVGMCLNYPQSYHNALDDVGLFLGASPDAIIQYQDEGTCEVLEVKNHCPFKTSPHHRHQFLLHSSTKMDMKKIPAYYIPQIMLEIFCFGHNCKSAIMIRQTISESYILRIYRDDGYINQMITFLLIFHNAFVRKQKPPPQNFFWDMDDYQKFLSYTKRLENAVELVDVVTDIQRMQFYNESLGDVPLFLDDFL